MAKKAKQARRYKKGGVRRKAKRARRYNPQTGKPTGRAVGALARLEALTKKYQDQGMTLEAARQRAIDEMRDNTRRDWREG
jgi:hypothetical protein